ncbi:hypothetical protein [Myroides odoratimimus]|uniref:hypothetical protein n=1 Tax=Myroides odoratimimus TaxID=76832 RepID=UPI0025765F51|nr:hypothetical protein [Myroides odoratimimus]MDM1093403.1 hypothetical protein [Myroides odoratimimus]
MATLDDLRIYLEGKEPHEIGMILWDFTQRTTVLEELTPREIDNIYRYFITISKTPEDVYREELQLKEWRSNILSIATIVGIKEPTSFIKFNNWMKNSSKFKKQLNQLNLEQLKDVYKQLKMVEKNNTKSADSTMTKAWIKKASDLKNLN